EIRAFRGRRAVGAGQRPAIEAGRAFERRDDRLVVDVEVGLGRPVAAADDVARLAPALPHKADDGPLVGLLAQRQPDLRGLLSGMLVEMRLIVGPRVTDAAGTLEQEIAER